MTNDDSSDEQTDDGPSDARLLDTLRLNLVGGVGPRLQHLLVNRFGSVANIFRASRSELESISGIGPKLADSIREAANGQRAEQELSRCRAESVELLLRGESPYPSMLEEIHDPPWVMYSRGQLEKRDQLAVAIVGSRRCTLYGRQQAERLSGALVRAGITVVSGLARGIDSVAHRAALEAGGRTIAVAATGLAITYPPEHKELAHDISKAGAIVSESCLDQPPVPGLFPQRNRIISGLSLGVIIIEANRKSGALHTARHAMEQGREVFALPGRVDSLASEGCHDLLRDGATLVRNVEDVFDSLGPLIEPVQLTEEMEVHSPQELSLNEQERSILGLITTEPQHIDAIVSSASIDPPRVLSTITVLEMKRLIQRLPGGRIARANFRA